MRLPRHETADVFGMKLILQGRPKGIGAVASQIVVEITPERRERYRLDPEARCSGDQAVSCDLSGRVAIPDDIESTQRRWEQDGREVSGRKRRQHRHPGQNLTGRQHGLDALASRKHLTGIAEADGVPEKVAQTRTAMRRSMLPRLSLKKGSAS